MALIAVPSGHVGAVVTTLELTARPPLRPLENSELRLLPWPQPRLDAYRTLFRRVGTSWLWYSRLLLDDAALSAIIARPGQQIFAVIDRAGIELGLLELNTKAPSEIELAYFALVPELTGRGFGHRLLAEAIARVWRRETRRMWVRTCTLDHPTALEFYRKQGFVAIKRELETFPDPRLLGVLPRDAAPQIPLLPLE